MGNARRCPRTVDVSVPQCVAALVHGIATSALQPYILTAPVASLISVSEFRSVEAQILTGSSARKGIGIMHLTQVKRR